MALAGAVVLGFGTPAFAANAPGAPTPTTSTTLPPLPNVPLSITDGQPAATLLSNAIALSSVGIDTSALSTAIAATQAKLDSDAKAAAAAEAAARNADAAAKAATAQADVASSDLDGLQNAVKAAVVYLYTSGPASLQVNPKAGAALLYAEDYADSALSPYGVLADNQQAAVDRKNALKNESKARRHADKLAAQAAKALADEQSQAGRLRAELAVISSASSAEVTADHLALATQAGEELLSAADLQFTPKTPLPPPVSTTPVAVTWAFSELGKPYLWGGTGPNAFDCSGLTQYVWRAAGVSIPRVAADQDAWAVPVPLSNLLPGDLVFYGRTDIHHVGIYIGDGLMINAPHTGDVVRVSSIWWSDLAGFGRVHTTGVPIPPHTTPSVSAPAKPVVVPTPGPVPSQTKPPKGWKPTPGSTTPIDLGTVPTSPTGVTTTTTSTTSTTVPVTATVPVTTTVPGLPDTTTSTTVTTVAQGTTPSSSSAPP
jgi:cell wall-associated NlpC family hydrolase